MSTGDNARFIRNWSEVSLSNITFSCSSNEESISLQQNGILSIMAELIVNGTGTKSQSQIGSMMVKR